MKTPKTNAGKITMLEQATAIGDKEVNGKRNTRKARRFLAAVSRKFITKKERKHE